jgi:hypothetical protein
MKRRTFHRLRPGIWGVLLLGLAERVLWAQCAMCRTGLLSSPEGQSWAGGFNRGVLFLLLVPFGVVGAIAALIWRASRRRRREGLAHAERACAEAPHRTLTSSPVSG